MREILKKAAEALGLQVTFVSQSASDNPMVRGEWQGKPLHVMHRQPLDEVRALPIPYEQRGDYVGVPVQASNGTLFGTFCFASHNLPPWVVERNVEMLRSFAELAAADIERDILLDRLRDEKESRIKALLASAGPTIVYQPVFMLDDMRIAGSEALSRFPWSSGRSVDVWFKDAAEVGLQVELELLAIKNALRDYRVVWAGHRLQLGLNASAATILDDRLWAALEGYPRDLIVIELTEHDEVQDYTTLLTAINRLRSCGTKIAIDDVGAGYASMRHVLMLRPDILKLDVGLIRTIDADDLRLALASSLKHFADHFACRVVAEGVETKEELAVLRELKLQASQGNLLGRPAPPESLLVRLGQTASAA